MLMLACVHEAMEAGGRGGGDTAMGCRGSRRETPDFYSYAPPGAKSLVPQGLVNKLESAWVGSHSWEADRGIGAAVWWPGLPSQLGPLRD